MNPQEVDKLFDQFTDFKVLIIGDSMIDAYMWGHIERMSPEADVPVVRIDKQEKKLGGAANVALNIRSLGAYPILLSAVGKNENAHSFFDLMLKDHLNTEGVIELGDRPTTVKTRVINGEAHVLRVDEESIEDITAENEVIALLKQLLHEHTIDVAIFQDYNKGFLTENIIQTSIELLKEANIPMAVDPKKKNFNCFKGVDLFKPNFKEMVEGMELEIEASDDSSLLNAMSQLRSELECETVLLTRSEYGIAAINDRTGYSQKAFDREIVDVSGAGDSVISIAALGLGSSLGIEQLACLSNLAGGLACEEVGVNSIDPHRLKEEFNRFNENAI